MMRYSKYGLQDLRDEVCRLEQQLEDRVGETHQAQRTHHELLEGRMMRLATRLEALVDTASESHQSIDWLSKRVTELEQRLLDHHEVVLVNDGGSPRSTSAWPKYTIYRGRTPQGKRIHEIRRPGMSEVEYHVEGVAMKDEELQ